MRWLLLVLVTVVGLAVSDDDECGGCPVEPQECGGCPAEPQECGEPQDECGAPKPLADFRLDNGEVDCQSDSKRFLTQYWIPYGQSDRAYASVPPEIELKNSSIPGAGLGTFATTFIRKWTWLAEYEGEIMEDSHPGGYGWMIHMDGKFSFMVDAWDVATSNWPRWVNSARHVSEQKVDVRFCRGRVYYMVNEDVQAGEELLTYYGHGYGKSLGVDTQHYYNRDWTVDGPKKKEFVDWDWKNNEMDCQTDMDKFLQPQHWIPYNSPDRARRSLPPQIDLRNSSIPGAGRGTFATTFIKKWTWLAEYEGEVVPRAHEGGYGWTIQRGSKYAYMVDAWDEATCNWPRWVNSARHVKEQNVIPKFCKGRVYYLTDADVYPGEELMTYYGHGYGRTLGVDTRNYYNQRIDITPYKKYPTWNINGRYNHGGSPTGDDGECPTDPSECPTDPGECPTDQSECPSEPGECPLPGPNFDPAFHYDQPFSYLSADISICSGIFLILLVRAIMTRRNQNSSSDEAANVQAQRRQARNDGASSKQAKNVSSGSGTKKQKKRR